MILPLPRLAEGAAWFGAWLLDRVLREVEDRATAGVVDKEFDCGCQWCPTRHFEKRSPAQGAPTDPPRGWLESRRYPGYYWCSLRCWSEHFASDAGVSYPAGENWDEALQEDS